MSLNVFDLFDHQNDFNSFLPQSFTFYFYRRNVYKTYLFQTITKKLQDIVKKEKKYHFNNSKNDVTNTDWHGLWKILVKVCIIKRWRFLQDTWQSTWQSSRQCTWQSTRQCTWQGTCSYLCLVFWCPGWLRGVYIPRPVQSTVTVADKFVDLSLVVLVRESTARTSAQI